MIKVEYISEFQLSKHPVTRRQGRVSGACILKNVDRVKTAMQCKHDIDMILYIIVHNMRSYVLSIFVFQPKSHTFVHLSPCRNLNCLHVYISVNTHCFEFEIIATHQPHPHPSSSKISSDQHVFI